MDYKQLAQRIEATTGGLAAHSKVVDSPFEHDKFSFDLSLTSHALESNTEAMFSLWQQVLNETRWNDYDRLKVLIEQIKTRLHDSLLEDGYVHARTFASARIIPAYVRS
jgi:Zn-dependent M16 (insulinase) family peptidase